MPAEQRFYDKGTFLIAVDRYHRGELSGVFYHPVRRESGTFASVIQLLLQMEQRMDQENLPQSFHAPRSFASCGGCFRTGDACRFISGREATFVVNVRFRRNSSWQGDVFYQGDSRPRPFRSVLELIGLMDSLLEGSAAPPMELAE